MAVILQLTEGWTKPVGPVTLRNAGAPINLTGKNPRLIFRGKSGSEVIVATDDLDIAEQSGATLGQVSFVPPALLKAQYSPYTMRFEVTEPDGVVYFPHGEADEVEVYKR